MRICLFALAVMVGGCHWTLDDKGTDPRSDQLYFPTGLAMDPDGRHLYIANGNADLRYGGGHMMIADVSSFECATAKARGMSAGAATAPPLPESCKEHDDNYWSDIVTQAKC